MTAASGPYRLLLATSGFAAHSILSTEDGLHLLETPADVGKRTHAIVRRYREEPSPLVRVQGDFDLLGEGRIEHLPSGP